MLTSRAIGSSLERVLTLNHAFDQALSASLGNPDWVPALDVAERRDAFIVQAELPGVSPDQVDITFEQNILTLRGTKPTGLASSNGDRAYMFAAERAGGSFERSVRLPEHVDADHIAATFANGLLTVTVPKAAAAQPRKILINSSNGTS